MNEDESFSLCCNDDASGNGEGFINSLKDLAGDANGGKKSSICQESNGRYSEPVTTRADALEFSVPMYIVKRVVVMVHMSPHAYIGYLKNATRTETDSGTASHSSTLPGIPVACMNEFVQQGVVYKER